MTNKVRQAHGENICGLCKKQADALKLAEHITKVEVMRCDQVGYNGPVKPDINFF